MGTPPTSSASGIATSRAWSEWPAPVARPLPPRLRRGRLALSAFHSLCERVGRGQFPQLADRDDLWRLLVTITARKVISALRHQTRQKRGGGKVVGESW